MATELIKVARLLTAIDFPSDRALRKYLKEHPAADKGRHKVVRQKPGGSSKQPTNLRPKPKRVEKPKPKMKPEAPERPTKKRSPSTTPHKKVKVNPKAMAKVQRVLSSNGIQDDSDEMQELAGFKQTLGQRVPDVDAGKFFVRNERKLKTDFVKNMNPDNYSDPESFKGAKQRIMDMSVGDFGKVLAALTGDDEEE